MKVTCTWRKSLFQFVISNVFGGFSDNIRETNNESESDSRIQPSL